MRTIEEVIAELRKDIHSDVYLGKKTINTYLDEILEIYKAEKPQGDVAYLCDGYNCPADKASCKHGGPCRHTTNIEHAINFRRFPDTDKFYEVENVMRIEGQENQ